MTHSQRIFLFFTFVVASFILPLELLASTDSLDTKSLRKPNSTTLTEAESPEKTPLFIGKKTGISIFEARSEDITPENYPNVINSFVFPNAELKDVIKTMSVELNINIIMSPEIANKKISIISYSPITVAEAYQAFLSALSIHDLTVIRSGSFLKIVSSDTALKSNVEVYEGNKTLRTDQFITRIIKLKYIDATSLESKIKPLIDSKSVKSLIFYPPSNMVIISDYGLNVEKIRKIIQKIDIPNEDSIFSVIPIKHAQANKLSEIIASLLSARPTSSFRYRRNTKKGFTIKEGDINISSLTHDERTNSIIVKGNKQGIEKVKDLIQQLDYYKDPELAGGIFVYKVRHGIATDLAATLNEVIGKSTVSRGVKSSGKRKSISQFSQSAVSYSTNLKKVATAQSFEDVRIIAEKHTNSLLIVANKYNYETILNILKKVDISRNQVFVKAIIMEINTDKTNDWNIANYYFPKDGNGISRIGYGIENLTSLTGITEGATLMFPLQIFGISRKDRTNIGSLLSGNTSQNDFLVPTLSSFVKFLQKTAGANVLYTPQVIALDHQEAKITIKEEIPIVGSLTASPLSGGNFLPSVSKDKVSVTTELAITPHINPDVNSVRMQIQQKIDNPTNPASIPERLRGWVVGVKKRTLSTSITLQDNETAVLGGLATELTKTTDSKIPLLGDLPLIGWLFKNSKAQKKKSNMLVLITPHIIRSTTEHRNILSNKLKDRMDFIRQFTGSEDPYKDFVQDLLKGSVSKQDSPLIPLYEEDVTEEEPDDEGTTQPPLPSEERVPKKGAETDSSDSLPSVDSPLAPKIAPDLQGEGEDTEEFLELTPESPPAENETP